MLEDGLMGNFSNIAIGFEKGSVMSENAVIHVRNAYGKEEGVSWEICCRKAIESLKHMPLGMNSLINWRIVQRYYLEFKANERKFIVLSNSIKDTQKYIPELLLVYPDMKQAILDFCNNNLGDFSADIVHLYINKCIDIIVRHDAMFLTIDDSNSSSEEVSDSSIEKNQKTVG
eukprot:6248435-Ditylum_brightwellii.AAC.1